MSMTNLEIDGQYNHLVKTLIFVLIKRLNKFYLKTFCDEKAFLDILTKVISRMNSLEQNKQIEVKFSELTTELMAILDLQKQNQDIIPPKPVFREQFNQARQIIKEQDEQPTILIRTQPSTQIPQKRTQTLLQQFQNANLYQQSKTTPFKPVIYQYTTKVLKQKGYQNKLKNRINVKKKKKFEVNNSLQSLSNDQQSIYLYQKSRGSRSINNISFSDSSFKIT